MNIQRDTFIKFATEINLSLSNQLMGPRADIVTNSNQINSEIEGANELLEKADNLSKLSQKLSHAIINIINYFQFCYDQGVLPSMTSLAPSMIPVTSPSSDLLLSETSTLEPIQNQTSSLGVKENSSGEITVPSKIYIKKHNGEFI